MPSGRSKSLTRTILTISSLPALLAASYFYYPSVFDGPPICWFKLSLGLPCMGCGLTRAFACLSHGEIGRAFQFHALAPLVLAYLLVWYVIEMARLYNASIAPRWFAGFGRWMMILLALLFTGRMVMFFSHPDGARSVLLQNGVMRLIRLDLSNTYEPISLDTRGPAGYSAPTSMLNVTALNRNYGMAMRRPSTGARNLCRVDAIA